jgi:hypothetical protein
MAEVLNRFVQTLRLKRDAFVWMDFNDRATGDALILVALTAIASFAGYFAGLRSLFNLDFVELLIGVVLSSLIQWLLYSGIAWAIVRYGWKAEAEFSTYLRFTGFAYPTTLLTVVIALVLNRIGLLTLFLGFAWFIFIIGRGMEYASDLPRDKALVTAVGALLGLIIVDTLLSLSPLT